MNEGKNKYHLGSGTFQNLFGALRTLLFLGTLLLFAAYCGLTFDLITPKDLAIVSQGALLKNAPDWLLFLITAAINRNSLRFMIPPFAAMVCVIFAGALYLKDVYELPGLKLALQYILASMFTIAVPKLVVDKGAKQLKKGQLSLIDRIGGPGFVLVEPGNAAIFRQLRGPSNSRVSATYFLAPFETLAHTVDLVEQQGDKGIKEDKADGINAQTRDGIKVLLRDVHFRYRIKQLSIDGKPIKRSLIAPYPFTPDALTNMVQNLTIPPSKNGQDDPRLWNNAIEGAVVGTIIGFVSSHSIDELTAPRRNNRNPQFDIRKELLTGGIKNNLEKLGAELLWVDVGHLEIVEDCVDEKRTKFWASDWIKDAEVIRASGEARRIAYQELGRAEAQSDLILCIADSLRNASLSNSSRDNVRKILLARTAQFLDALSETTRNLPGDIAKIQQNGSQRSQQIDTTRDQPNNTTKKS